MRYRISPLNVLALLCIIAVIYYFAVEASNDRHGWSAVFLLFPAIVVGIFSIATDVAIQAVLKSKEYRWFIISEILLILLAFIWLKLHYFIP